MSNPNDNKSSCGLCFWASDPLIDRFYLNLSINGKKPKNKGHMNFYDCCDLTKKYRYLMYIPYLVVLQLLAAFFFPISNVLSIFFWSFRVFLFGVSMVPEICNLLIMRMWFELRHIFQGPKFLIKSCLKTNFKTARGKFLWITKNLPLWAAPVKQNIQKSKDVKFELQC